MTKQIMLDLETMGQNSNAAIIAIGAVKFDTVIRDEFYCNVDLQSSVSNGGIIDPSTVMWWLKQSQQARDAVGKPGLNIFEALNQFRTWLNDLNVVVWGNGSDFDNVILGNAYRSTGLDTPWKFYNNRCYRTIAAMNKHIPKQTQGVAHNALDDAKTQALHLMQIISFK